MSEWTLLDQPLRARTAAAVDDDRLHTSISKAVARFGDGRVTAMATLENPDALRSAARRMRHDILSDLPAILEQFAANATAAGVHIHWALTAADANSYIVSLAQRLAAEKPANGPGVVAVKGKSMATEETALNHALEAGGCEVVETDLGEWIIQLAGQTPSHLIAPAVHLDRFQVRDILQRVAPPGEQLSSEPELLARFARRMLRERFLAADLGITGCNLAVAETGSIVLVENEGNGRMSTTVPRVHIAVMGVERIVRTWAEADLTLNLLARSASGQHLSTYTNIITGPRRGDEADGPDEVHIVILDNGRTELLGTEFEEALNCIRCGACLNVCPVYRQVGGHAYGWVYSGPIGAVLTPLLAGEHDESAEVAGASTLCGACMDACPVEIPLQDLLLSLRRRKAAVAAKPEKGAWRLWAQAWGRPVTYEASLKAMATGRSLSRLASMAPGLRNWGDGRSGLKPAARSFTERWKAGEV
jgi:L-lactate dehydrogenase complex protein LldF